MADYGSQLPDTTMLLKGIPQKIPEKDEDFVYGGIVDLRDRSLKFLWKLLAQNAYKTKAYILEYEIDVCARRLESFSFIHAVSIAHYKLALIRQLFQISIATFYKRQFIPSNPYVNSPYSGHHIDEEWPATINMSNVTFVDFIRDCTSFLKEKIRETRSNPNSQSSSDNSQDTTSQSSIFTPPPNSQNNNSEQLRRYAEILSLSTEEIAGIFPDLSAFENFVSFGRSEIPPEDTTIVQGLKGNLLASSGPAPEIYELVEDWSIASSPKNLTIASCSPDAVLEIDNEDDNLVEHCSPKNLQIASFSSASELEIDCYIVSSPKSLKITPCSIATTLEINNVDDNLVEDCYIISSPKNLKIASYSSIVAPEINNVDDNLVQNCFIVSPRKNLKSAPCSSQSISSKVPAVLRSKAHIKKKLTKRNLRSTSSMTYNLRRTKTEAVGTSKSKGYSKKKHSGRDKEDDCYDTKSVNVPTMPEKCNSTVDLDNQKYEINSFQLLFLSSDELFNHYCSKISAEPTLDINAQNNCIQLSSSGELLGFSRIEDGFQPMFQSSTKLSLPDSSAANSTEPNVIVDIKIENEEQKGVPKLLGFTSETDGFQPICDSFSELKLLANNVKSYYTLQSSLPGLLGFTGKADGFEPMFNFSEELTELGFLGFAEYNIGTGADLMHLDCEFEHLGSNVNLENDNSNSEPTVAEAIRNETEQIISTLSEPTESHYDNLLNLLAKSKKIESLHCNTHEVKQKNSVNQNANNALLEFGEMKAENIKDTSILTSPEIELNIGDTVASKEQGNADSNDLVTYQGVTSTFMEDSEIPGTVIQKISPQNNESVELAEDSSLPIEISDTEDSISLESAQDLENTTTPSLFQESLNTPDLDVNQVSTHEESTGNYNLDEAIIESSQENLTSQSDLGIKDNLVSTTANNIVKQNSNDMTKDLVPINDNSKYSSDELSSLLSSIGGSYVNSFIPNENISELPVDSTNSENTTDLDVGSYIENLWQVIDSANTEVNYNIKTPDYKTTSSIKYPNNINTELTEQVNSEKINDAENNQVVEIPTALLVIQKSFSSGSSILPQYSPLSTKGCSLVQLVGVPETLDIGNTEDNTNIVQSNVDNPESDSDNAIIKNNSETIDATSSNEDQNKTVLAEPIISPSSQESTSSGSIISLACSPLLVKGCSLVQLEIDIDNTIFSSPTQKHLKISDEDNIDARNINKQIKEGNEVEVSDIQDIVVPVSNISSTVQTDYKIPDSKATTDNKINSQNIEKNSAKIVSTNNVEIFKPGLEIPITKLDYTSKNNQINSNNIELSEAPGLAPNTRCCMKSGCVCSLFNKLVSNEEFNAEFNTVDLNINTDSDNIGPELVSSNVPDNANTLNYAENDGPINHMSEDQEELNEQLIKSYVVNIETKHESIAVFSASNASVEKAETENSSTNIKIDSSVFDSKSDIEINDKTKQQNKHAVACKSKVLEEPNKQLIKPYEVNIETKQESNADFSASNASVEKAKTENISTNIEIDSAVFDSKSDIEINDKTKQQNKHAEACKSSAKQHELKSTGSSKCETLNELKNLKHESDSSDSVSSTNSDSESSSSDSTSSSSSSDESMIQDNLELTHEQPTPENANIGDELTSNEKIEVNNKPRGIVDIESSNNQQNHQKHVSTQENTENISILKATSVQPGTSKPISILRNRAKIYNDDYGYLKATKRFFDIEPLGLHIIKNDPFLSNYGTVNANDSPNINTANVAHEEIPADDDYIPESLNQAQLFDDLMILDDLNTNENCTRKYSSETKSNRNLKNVKTAVSIKSCTNNKQFKQTILKTIHKKVNIKKPGILKPGVSIKQFSNITSKQPNLKSVLKTQVEKDFKIIKSAASIKTYTNKKLSQQTNNSQLIISSLHANKFSTTRPATSIRVSPTNNTCEKVEKDILQLNNELTNKVAALEPSRNNSSYENLKQATTNETSQLNIINLPESGKEDNQKSTTGPEKQIGKANCETSHLHKDLVLSSDSDHSSDEPSPLYSPVGGNSSVLNENNLENVHHIGSVVIDASMEPVVGTAEPKVFSFSQDLDIIPNELQFICPVPLNTQGNVNIAEPNSDNSATSVLPDSSLSSITDCNTLQQFDEIIKSCTVNLSLTPAKLVQVPNTIDDNDEKLVEVPSLLKDNKMYSNNPGITVENFNRPLEDLKELNNTTAEKQDSKHDERFVFSSSSSRSRDSSCFSPYFSPLASQDCSHTSSHYLKKKATNNNANSEDHQPGYNDDSNIDNRQASPASFGNDHSLIKNPQEVCPNAQTNIVENTDQKIEETVEEDKTSSENFKHDHCYLEALGGHDDETNIEDACSQDDANISLHLHGVILDLPPVTRPSPVREMGSITEEESQRILYGPPAKTEEISESTLDQTTDHADKENAGPSSPQESISDIDSILGEFLIFSDKKYKSKSKESLPSTEESTPQLGTCIPDDNNDKTEQVNAETIEVAIPEPKKRGRKPKPKPEGEKPPPKKRGRKPKPKPEGEVVKQPKKRGRPRHKTGDETEDEGTKPPPRKRGRKPGSSSKPPVLGILQPLVGHGSFVIESDEEYIVIIGKIK